MSEKIEHKPLITLVNGPFAEPVARALATEHDGVAIFAGSLIDAQRMKFAPLVPVFVYGLDRADLAPWRGRRIIHATNAPPAQKRERAHNFKEPPPDDTNAIRN